MPQILELNTQKQHTKNFQFHFSFQVAQFHFQVEVKKISEISNKHKIYCINFITLFCCLSLAKFCFMIFGVNRVAQQHTRK